MLGSLVPDEPVETIDVSGHKVAVLSRDAELVSIAKEILKIYLKDTPRTLLFAHDEVIKSELAKNHQAITGEVCFLIDDLVLIVISIIYNRTGWRAIPSVLWNLEDQVINV